MSAGIGKERLDKNSLITATWQPKPCSICGGRGCGFCNVTVKVKPVAGGGGEA